MFRPKNQLQTREKRWFVIYLWQPILSWIKFQHVLRRYVNRISCFPTPNYHAKLIKKFIFMAERFWTLKSCPKIEENHLSPERINVWWKPYLPVQTLRSTFSAFCPRENGKVLISILDNTSDIRVWIGNSFSVIAQYLCTAKTNVIHYNLLAVLDLTHLSGKKWREIILSTEHHLYFSFRSPSVMHTSNDDLKYRYMESVKIFVWYAFAQF